MQNFEHSYKISTASLVFELVEMEVDQTVLIGEQSKSSQSFCEHPLHYFNVLHHTYIRWGPDGAGILQHGPDIRHKKLFHESSFLIDNALRSMPVEREAYATIERMFNTHSTSSLIGQKGGGYSFRKVI